MNRRELLTSTGTVLGSGVALQSLLAPVKALGAEAKPVRIKNIETFGIEIPATPTEVEAGVMNRVGVTRVETESGVSGYAFGGGGGRGGAGGNAAGFQRMRSALIGSDLFALEQHLKKGLLERSEEHTSELQSPCNLVCRLLLEKKKIAVSN